MDFPAKIMLGADDDASKRISQHAIDADIEFLIVAEVSNTNLDAKFRVMDLQSLKNFARDLEASVPFLASHNMSMPLGRSIGGKFDASGERTLGEFKVLRDWNFGVSSDEYIKGVRAGMIPDVSMGCQPSDVTCNLCGKTSFMFSWNWESDEVCMKHFPGETYDGKQATVTIVDAELVEVSGVVAGATPGAEVLEYAHRASVASGCNVSPGAVRQIRSWVSTALPFLERGSGIAFTGSGLPLQVSSSGAATGAAVEPVKKTGGVSMDMEQAVAQFHGRARGLLDTVPSDAIASLETVLDALETSQSEVTRLDAEVSRLKRYESLYTAIEAAEIEAAVQSGIRAKGDAFDADSWKGIFGALTIQQIRVQAAEWEAEAERVLGDGSRQTADAPDAEPSEPGSTTSGSGDAGGSVSDAKPGQKIYTLGDAAWG